MESGAVRLALRVWVVLVVLFLFTPIILILVYAFNASNIQTWPIAGLSSLDSEERPANSLMRGELRPR